MVKLGGTFAVALLTLLAASCGQDEKAAAPSPTAAVETVHVAVLGDSLAGTNWPTLYGEHVAAQLGRPVAVEVLTAMGVSDGASLVASSPESVADADIVIVQTGFNNAMPDPETGIGCPGSLGSQSDKDILRWIRTNEPTCLAEGIKTYAGLYDQIFAGVKAARAGKPTVFVAMTTVDGNNDPNMPDGLIGMMPEAARPEVLEYTLAAYDRWNTMLTSRAEAADFQVVDLFHAIHGPQGSGVVGDLSDDGGHPNAKGDDFYVRQLEAVDLSALNDT
jgi:GDSL-like Lipase/Acylhydrolase family